MRLLRLVGIVLCGLALSGCDGSEPPAPLSLEQQVAGTWEVVSVTDLETDRSLMSPFQRMAGDWRFTFGSVGCCAGSAAYALDIRTPAGTMIQREGRYYPNSGGGIILEDLTRMRVAGGSYEFGSGTAQRRMAITTRARGAVDELGSGAAYDLSGDPFGQAIVRMVLRETDD